MKRLAGGWFCLAGVVLLSGCSNLVTWSPPPSRQASNQPASLPPPPPEPTGPGEYRVVAGDTVYSIAFRNSMDYRDLAKWNGVGADFLIRPGQVLKLEEPKPYTEKFGDSESIAAPDLQLPEKSARPVALPIQKPDIAVIPGEITPQSYRRITPPAAAKVAPQPVPATPSASTPPTAVGAAPASPGTSAPAARPATAASDDSPDAFRWHWPTNGIVVRGYNPGAGSKGLDFTGQVGQQVVAAAPGKVVYSGSALKGYGELIIIKHDDLRLSAYGYNRARLVNEGQMVAGGQPIAELGLGPENKPILHFEIRERGQPINPVPYLAAKSAVR
ncbi:MAG: peptidoglycan DD-metalloendopeptidase family protein [Panacagrimonas sp.]